MSRSLIETGLSKWYFASPDGMGIFIPILQTLGMLFNYSYTWFIQPLLSVMFISLFIYFSYSTAKRNHLPKWVAFFLPIALFGVMLSSNLFFVFTTYIHTNFDSALFLFLSITTLLFYFNDKNENWLYFSTLFLIIFGLTRVENIIFAFLLIIIVLGENKLPHQKLITTFVPYLVIQLVWYLMIFMMKTDSFTDQMSQQLLLLVLIAIFGLITLLFISEVKWIKQIIKEYFRYFFPLFLLVILITLLVIAPQQTLQNILTNLENMYVVGNWWSAWWFVTVLGIITLLYAPKVPNERIFIYLIISFFVMVLALGGLRTPYHIYWSDSANRMFVHILPIILYYFIEKFSLFIHEFSMEITENNQSKLI